MAPPGGVVARSPHQSPLCFAAQGLFQTNLSHLQAHLILDETLGAGYVMDTNQQSVTAPLNKLPVHATRSTSLKP
jgi:hypothetical protein